MVHSRNSHRELKLISAVVGMGATVVMAALGIGLSGALATAQDDDQAQSPVASTGETVTETRPAKSPETSLASPAVSATTPSGFATPH